MAERGLPRISVAQDARKDEQHQGEDELDGRLGRFFLGQLAAAKLRIDSLCTRRCLGDAGTELSACMSTGRQGEGLDAGCAPPLVECICPAVAPSATGNWSGLNFSAQHPVGSVSFHR